MRLLSILIFLILILSGCSLFKKSDFEIRKEWIKNLDRFWEYYHHLEDSLNLSKNDYMLMVDGCGGCYEGSTPILYIFEPKEMLKVRKLDIYGEYQINNFQYKDFYEIQQYLGCMQKDSLWIGPEFTLFEYYDIKIKIKQKKYHFWIDDGNIVFDDKFIPIDQDYPNKCLKNLTVYIRSLLPKGEFDKKRY